MGMRLFFSAGDPSGDLHASNLIRCLKGVAPHCEVRGFGGPRMLEAGLDQDFDLTLLAVMGITEVLPKLRDFFRLADQAEECFKRGEVDAVVLVDFPGFNWHIAKRAKKYGLPVYYYLPPQIWAWGSWRVEKMKRWVDHVLCNLPFEEQWFAEHGVPATFVGHPFFDVVADTPLDERFLNRWRTDERLQVAVLPGSRNHEVHRMWPLQLQIVRQLAARFPDVEFLVAALKDSHAQWCRDQLAPDDRRLPIHIFSGKTSEVIELADCALMKSGSVSLEIMARNTPAVVMYHVNNVTYLLAKMLVRCKSASLPNLIADETIMPEFLSHGSLRSKSARRSVQQATEEMSRLLADPNYRQQYEMRLQWLASEVAKPGASRRAAQWIASQFA
ncbi:MAG: lipid-A-disaccharide synthase, partial [Planctomycetota bacterium]